VLSNDAAGSRTSVADSAVWLPVRAVETLALTEAPEMALNVVSANNLVGLCKVEGSSKVSFLKEPLKVSESRVLESSVNLSELEGVMAGDSKMDGLT
jgi:hypothetical protein